MTTTTRRDAERPLDGWKAIASFLGRSIRTAQRWEKLSGMPVHRIAPDRPGCVFAYREELVAWLLASEERHRPTRGVGENQPAVEGGGGARRLGWAARAIGMAIGLLATVWTRR